MSGIAIFAEPIRGRTRTEPERNLAIIGIVDDVNYAQGHSQFQFVAIEEDGIVSRFGISEVSIDWRYDDRKDRWFDLHEEPDSGEPVDM